MEGIKATVQSGTSHPEGTEVQVEVIGPPLTPNFTRSLRARATAIRHIGRMDVAEKAIENITVREIKKFTKEVNDPIREKRGSIEEATLHTIVVRDK